MPTQLRIYKIKQGQMDAFSSFFQNKVVPLHERFGIPVRIAWVNSSENEFVWARDFSADEPIDVQERRYLQWDERIRTVGDESKGYIDSMTVRIVDLLYESR